MSDPVIIPQDYVRARVPSYVAPSVPRVPSTPGPRSINNITEDAYDRFAGVLWVQKDGSKSTEDYLVDYEHWEPYSEVKSYTKRVYQAAYNGRMCDYVDFLFVLSSNGHEDYFVVSKRVKTELDDLQEYCPCVRCDSYIFNPLRYIWCPICTKCIKAGPGFTSSENIALAKARKQGIKSDKTVNWKLAIVVPIVTTVLYFVW